MVLSDLAVGSYVQDPNTKYNGTVIVWQILEHGHQGDPAGSTTLQSRDVVCVKCFDAAEPDNVFYYSTRGNSHYNFSNILQWLNSDKDNWYTPQHPYDEPPSSAYVGSKVTPFDDEPGFLTYFSIQLREVLMTSTRSVKVPAQYSFDNIDSISKVFLLSITELGSTEGYVLGYEYQSYTLLKNLINTSTPTAWTTRSIGYSNSDVIHYVSYQGVISSSNTDYAYGKAGIAPGICIPSNTKVEPSSTSGVYNLKLLPAVKQIYIGDSSNHAVPIL